MSKLQKRVLSTVFPLFMLAFFTVSVGMVELNMSKNLEVNFGPSHVFATGDGGGDGGGGGGSGDGGGGYTYPPYVPYVPPSCTNGASNYPYCNNVCTNGYTNYPTCGPTTCSNGATNFPYCNNNVCTNGATNYPSCNNNRCTNGATNYPYCNNVCTNGYTNYPTCGPTTCSNGATNFPYCNNNVCTNGATNYPSCNNQCTPLGAETQYISCGYGQTGQITQQRTHSCPSNTWSMWNTINNTCANNTCTNGATNYPYCNNNVCSNGATNYPSCNNNNVCTNGYSNYPTCGPTTCSNGTTNFPYCNQCPYGQTYLNGYCSNNNVCTNGYSNYPTCGPTTCTNGATNFPSCNNNYCSNGATNFPACNNLQYVYCNGIRYNPGYVCPVQQPTCPSVSTTGATPANSTATIYGYVNTSNNNANISFDYGTSAHNLQWKTTTQSTNYSGQFSAQLSGLSCGTRYYYRASASGSSCNQSGTTLSFVTPACQQVVPYADNSVITRLATSVGYNDAQLNGAFIKGDENTQQCVSFFNYGTNYNLVNRTAGQNLYSNYTVNYFSKAIGGLSPNTTYYYKAGVTCANGTKFGNIVSFKTPAIKYVYVAKKKIVYNHNYVKPKTEVSSTSTCLCDKSEYLTLLVENMENVATIGKVANYKISFKNISKENLSNIAVRVVLPDEETIFSASSGQYTKGTKTYLLTIPSLGSYEEGSVILTTTVDAKAQVGKQMIVNGYANYTVPTIVKGGQPLTGEVTAYALSTTGTQDGITNNAGMNGNITNANSTMPSWLPTSFMEWVISLLVFAIFISALKYVFTAFKSAN